MGEPKQGRSQDLGLGGAKNVQSAKHLTSHVVCFFCRAEREKFFGFAPPRWTEKGIADAYFTEKFYLCYQFSLICIVFQLHFPFSSLP